MKQYGLYNVKDYEQCVYFGTIKEIATYLKLKPQTLLAYLCRRKHNNKLLLNRCYELIEIKEQNNNLK